MRENLLVGFLTASFIAIGFVYYNYYSSVISYNNKLKNFTDVQLFPYLPIELGEQVINIKASFVPLVLSSLIKDIASIPKNQLGSIGGLLNWTRPFKSEYGFGAKSFSVFLPPSSSITTGVSWWIIQPSLDEYIGQMSSVKHLPSEVEPKYRPLFALLSLFHPKPFLWTRFAPQGTCATLKAVGANYYDIVFRMHAEFQLNEPPVHPFWFTPSQFKGRLIINKDSSIVHYFHMEVPDRKLNVDMEWLNGPNEDSMEVDIGYIPEMSLEVTAISTPFEEDMGVHENIVNITWDHEITDESAYNVLEKSFYAFKQIKYYSLSEAFHVAANESKLVHGIILWGNLDDQSC